MKKRIMKRTAYPWRKVYVRFFLKYLLCFFIILIPFISIIYESGTIIRKQIIDQSQMQLWEGMNAVVTGISEMQFIEQGLKSNNAVDILSRTDGEIPYNKTLYIGDARNYLMDMQRFCTLSPYVFVLFRENDIVISSSQCEKNFSQYYYDTFFAASYEGEKLDAEEFHKLVFSRWSDVNSFIRLDKVSYSVSGKTYEAENAVLCVIDDNPLFSTNDRYRMGYLLLPDTLIDLLLMEEGREEGFVRITDAVGNVLLDYGNTAVITEGVDEIRDVGDYWMFSIHEEEITEWRVQLGISKSVIAEKQRSLYYLVWVYLVVGGALVLLFSYYFGSRQYRQLKDFYQLIPERQFKQLNGKYGYDELITVYRDIVKNSDYYLQQKSEMEKQNRTVRLEHLISEGITSQEELLELQQAGILAGDFYCIAILRMTLEENKEYGVVMLGITELLKKNWKEQVVHIHTGLQDELFLFTMPAGGAPNAEQVRKIFENIAYIFAEDMQITIGVGISAVGVGMENLNRCYEQAKHVLEAYYHRDKITISTYSVTFSDFQNIPVSPEFLKKMNQYILRQCTAEVNKCFQTIRDYYKKNPLQFEIQKEQVFYSVKNVIYNACLCCGENPEEGRSLPGFEKQDTVEQMTEKLQMAAIQLINRMKIQKDSEEEVFREGLLLYLEEHYADPEMAIGLICREKGVSEKYLQKVIKEKTGETFNVHLERLRLEHAEDLLMNTDMSNEQIAEAVGFGSVSTFYRIFNKRKGVSPKNYREGNDGDKEISPK